MSDSFNIPRLGLGFSADQRASLQRANKLKQELYAQQKKIQFSNLLERSGQDVESYIESQNNVFISSGRSSVASEDSGDPPSSGTSQLMDAPSDVASINPSFDDVDAINDRDGVDFFREISFSHNSNASDGRVISNDEDSVYDPAAPVTETLRDHLYEQMRLDGKFADLDPRVKERCFKIIDALDANGYLKVDVDPASRPELPANSIAYPEEDAQTLAAIEEFDKIFNLDSTREQRFRANEALEMCLSVQSSRDVRTQARSVFDSIVGRKTTREEREKAKKLLDSIEAPAAPCNPLSTLFPKDEQKEASEALSIVQSLDPPGVGARDLRESMLLRLRPDAKYKEQLNRLIRDYFDDFIKKRLGVLSKKSGISQEELMEIYSAPFPFFQSPGELFSNSVVPTRAVYPEIVVEMDKRGRWVARLDESIANVELDSYYQKMLLSKRVDKKTREYLRRQYVEAQALMDALRNRNSTLLRVAKAVVDFQEEYFANPNAAPKPLTQQQIADKLGLDASTVSRACNEKWLSTPHGYEPFKNLFPKAVSGEVTSSDVADKIRALISQEPPEATLSDEEIAAELEKRFGVKVSRKTVQEHRDQLQIPNSRVRKRLKTQKK